jgi:branched-chain amino acid aminotransferase
LPSRSAAIILLSLTDRYNHLCFYVNGEYVREEDATISVLDRGLLYGDACFESVGIRDGRLLFLDEHLARFERSARVLDIESPVAPEELREIVLETGARSGMSDTAAGTLRPLLTRGRGASVAGARSAGRPTLVVIPQVAEVDPRNLTPRSAAFVTVTRPAPSTLDLRIKSTNYLASVLAWLEADGRGAEVAILRDERGFVSEGHSMNLFAVTAGAVRTPPATSALAGITRTCVLEAAGELGCETAETALTSYDLLCADEVFGTSAMWGVIPIGSIDGRVLAEPAPGPMTRTLAAAYETRGAASGTPIERGAAV